MKPLDIFQQLLDKLVNGDIKLILIPCDKALFATLLLDKLNEYGLLWEHDVQVSWYEHKYETCYFIHVMPGITPPRQSIYVATMTISQCELGMSSVMSRQYAMLHVTAII
jgi:hypothetical protein